MINTEIQATILKVTSSERVIAKENIQPLWSGYGEIFRCSLAGGKYASVVVKQVKLPEKVRHPRGWNTDVGHLRKLKSYEVEQHWYQGLAKLCGNQSKIPELIYTSKPGEQTLMIMEDLNDTGFPVRKSHINLDEIKACLAWLANFHGTYMQVKPDGLWDIGTYWHLDTRPEEWQEIEESELKNESHAIDQKLNQAKYQTIVHGDAKLANFCFSKDGATVAAVDFQYVGGGCGMKDVAYFLSSCLDDEALEKEEESLLKYYFNLLEVTLSRVHVNIDIQQVTSEWKALYSYAWADFYRFLAGWSPGHWKINGFIKTKTDLVLKQLKQNKGS